MISFYFRKTHKESITKAGYIAYARITQIFHFEIYMLPNAIFALLVRMSTFDPLTLVISSLAFLANRSQLSFHQCF